MNVYSVRLIPSLKIKLCQFLGIASVLAVDELSLRLESLERKLDRLDSHLRRSSSRAMPVVEGKLPGKSVKKKPTSVRKAVVATPLKKKRAELKPLPRLAEIPEPVSIKPLVLETVEEGAEGIQVVAERREAVLLVQADDNTRRSAREFFGEEVDLFEFSELHEVAGAFDSHQVLAVLFDRALLGQNEFRGTLEILAQLHPEAQMIGLSSYLTLALADSLPEREDFATFLTRPLSVEALASVFGAGRRKAIS